MWTAESVQRELPTVRIAPLGGKLIDDAVLSGRSGRFATVTPRHSIGSFEVAWGTVADCLNSDRPIRY